MTTEAPPVFPPITDKTTVTKDWIRSNYYTKTNTDTKVATKVAKAGDSMTGELKIPSSNISASGGVFTNLTVANKANMPSPGNCLSYYLNYQTNSDLAGYQEFSSSPSSNAEIELKTAIVDTDGDKLIAKFATAIGIPNLNQLTEGTWEMYITVKIDDATDPCNVFFKLYRDDNGTPTLLGTSSEESVSTTATKIDALLTIQGTAFTPTEDRVIIEIYGNTADTSSRTLSLYFEGTTKTAFCYSPLAFYTPSTVPSLTVTNNTETTSTSTGALQVSGGIAAVKSMYAGYTGSFDTIIARSNIESTSTSSGSILSSGGISCVKSVYGGMTGSFDTVLARSSVDSTSTGTGSLKVSGGIASVKSIYGGMTGSFDTVLARGNIDSTSTATGTLRVSGGAAVSGNLYCGGTGSFQTLQATNTDRSVATKTPHGMVNIADTVLSFDDSKRQFTITPTSPATTFDYWFQGVKYTKTGAQSIVLTTDTDGLWYIYYVGDTLTCLQTNLLGFANIVSVANVYWNQASQVHLDIQEERHCIVMDPATHEYLHDTVGTRWGTGLGVSGDITGDGKTNSHAQVAVAAGSVYDEDIEIGITTPYAAGTKYSQIFILSIKWGCVLL